jgi:transposase
VVLDGTVIGRCMQRHRHLEFIRFLNAVERRVVAGKLIHVVLDNYATHKHPKVLAWLSRHPRWTFHFTPTSASWLNAVENFSKWPRSRCRGRCCGNPLPHCPAADATRASVRGRRGSNGTGDNSKGAP